VLGRATDDSDNPDLRDRGYVYWRLLAGDPETAKSIVLAEKPTIADDSDALEPALLEELMGQMSTLASVYHKSPVTFVPGQKDLDAAKADAEDEESDEFREGEFSDEEVEQKQSAAAAAEPEVDLLGMDLLSMEDPAPAPAPAAATLPQLLGADGGKGLQLSGRLARVSGSTVLQLQVVNVSSAAPAQAFALQFNKNSLALGPTTAAFQLNAAAAPGGGQGIASVALAMNPAMAKTDAPAPFVEAALKNIATNEVVYFRIPLLLEAALVEEGRMEQGPFVQQWKGNTKDNLVTIQNIYTADVAEISRKLQGLNIFFIAQRNQGNDALAYYSMKTVSGVDILAELTFRPGVNACRMNVKSSNALVTPFVQKCLQGALTA
jgi:AP-1 complex subunit beta-1